MRRRQEAAATPASATSAAAGYTTLDVSRLEWAIADVIPRGVYGARRRLQSAGVYNGAMEIDPLTHVPVAAGPAYIERIRQLPSKFTATLRVDPESRFNHTAVAVLAGSELIGYLPPDLARQYFDTLKNGPGAECPGRHAPLAAHEDTGVEVLLDLTGLVTPP